MKRWWIFSLSCLGIFCLFNFAHAQTTSTANPLTTNTTTSTSIELPSAISNNENQARGQNGTYESARLISIKTESQGEANSKIQNQVMEVEVRSGALKGKIISMSDAVHSNPYQIQPRVGDKLIVFIQQDEQGEHIGYLEGFDRRIPMLWLLIIFVVTLALLSGWQGIKVVFSIGVSLGLIGWILIPAFIKGINPVPIAIALSGIFTLISSGFVFGWNKKTLATTFGTMGGVFTALILSSIFSSWSHIGGLGGEEDRLFFSQNPTLDPRGLLLAGIIIAAMGVVEDVAVSIASGVEQVARANSNCSFKSLFTAGMIVGKDHTAAMANTIIFAYVGASLSTLLLYSQYDSNWLKFFNFDSVTEEIIRSLSATIGLVFTVPITAILAAWFNQSKKHIEPKKKTLIHTKTTE